LALARWRRLRSFAWERIINDGTQAATPAIVKIHRWQEVAAVCSSSTFTPARPSQVCSSSRVVLQFVHSWYALHPGNALHVIDFIRFFSAVTMEFGFLKN
jgi:hypothetical protein